MCIYAQQDKDDLCILKWICSLLYSYREYKVSVFWYQFTRQGF